MTSIITAERLSLTINGRHLSFMIEVSFVSSEGYFMRVQPYDITAMQEFRMIAGREFRNLTSPKGQLILPCAGKSERQAQAACVAKVNLIVQILSRPA